MRAIAARNVATDHWRARRNHAPLEAAARIEALWRDVMSAYLKTSTDSCLIQARNSGHSIHLTDPETILDAIRASVGHHGK